MPRLARLHKVARESMIQAGGAREVWRGPSGAAAPEELLYSSAKVPGWQVLLGPVQGTVRSLAAAQGTGRSLHKARIQQEDATDEYPAHDP